MPYFTGLLEIDVVDYKEEIDIEFRDIDDVISSALHSGFTLEQIMEGLTTYPDFNVENFVTEFLGYEAIANIYNQAVLNQISELSRTNRVLRERIETLEKKEDVMTASDIQEKLTEDEEVKISDVAY